MNASLSIQGDAIFFTRNASDGLQMPLRTPDIRACKPLQALLGLIVAHYGPSHALRSTCMRLMFHAIVTKLHSPCALSKPRILI